MFAADEDTFDDFAAVMGGMPSMSMPMEIPGMPGMPSFMGAESPPIRELVKEMDEETRRTRCLVATAAGQWLTRVCGPLHRLHEASARVQEAEWEAEIPAAVQRDLEEMFAILDKSDTGSITLSDWTEAGLDEAVFNQ